MKQDKGITMVSLVVTMIILMILAGISFNIMIGENGIITKAKQAKQNITLAGEAEAIQLNQLYYELETGEQMTEDEESSKKDEIIALLQKQIDELQKQVADLQKQIDNLSVSCAQKDAIIVNLQKQIEENEKTMQDLKNQIAVKDSTIADLQKQLTEKNNTITNLQTQLKDAQDKFTNLQNNYHALQNSYNNLNTEYSNFKSIIATAITNKGITTSANASAQVMANNISSITGTKVINLGNGTSFNVSNYSGYKNFTIDNFIVGIYSAGVTQTSHQEYNQSGRASGFTISKSYNASTGVLTLGGTSQQIYAWDMNGYARATSTQNFTCFAYLIY